jgi:hypothetical protein
MMKGTIEKVVRDKSTVFIDAAKTVTELAAKDPKKLIERVKDSKDVDPKVLAEFRKRFLDK